VEEEELLMIASSSVQAAAVGTEIDGCALSSRGQNLAWVSIDTTQEAVVCTQPIVCFEEPLDLEVRVVSAGTQTGDANAPRRRLFSTWTMSSQSPPPRRHSEIRLGRPGRYS
jgi:hypothetical protein